MRLLRVFLFLERPEAADMHTGFYFAKRVSDPIQALVYGPQPDLASTDLARFHGWRPSQSKNMHLILPVYARPQDELPFIETMPMLIMMGWLNDHERPRTYRKMSRFMEQHYLNWDGIHILVDKAYDLWATKHLSPYVSLPPTIKATPQPAQS